MGLFAEDFDAQVIGAGEGGAGAVGDLAGGDTGPDVQAEDRIRFGDFITPSSTIIFAPQVFLPSGMKSLGPSSAGWK